jgi:kinesin family protein 22
VSTPSNGLGLTKDYVQISRAVEMEVARRLGQRERERAEEERRSKEEKADNTEVKVKTPKKQARETLPSGVLTPLLQRHRDLDDELKSRLRELEMKLWVFDCSLYFCLGHRVRVAVNEVARRPN